MLVGVAPAVGAAVGLALAATGVSVCWPMLLAYASQGRERPAGIVSGVTATGYIGFVVGPAVIGTVAEVFGLRAAVLVLAVIAAGVAIAPARVTPSRCGLIGDQVLDGAARLEHRRDQLVDHPPVGGVVAVGRPGLGVVDVGDHREVGVAGHEALVRADVVRPELGDLAGQRAQRGRDRVDLGARGAVLPAEHHDVAQHYWSPR